jgi:predicted small lipoprotein YifL
MAKLLRLLIILTTALTLSLPLASCGKKGALDPPGSSDEDDSKKKSGG